MKLDGRAKVIKPIGCYILQRENNDTEQYEILTYYPLIKTIHT